MKNLIYVFFLPVFISACSGKISPSYNQVYNDSINQQLWTADWSADAKRIAIGGVDSVLRIYSGADMKLSNVYPMNSWIHVVKWNNDNVTLAIATLEGVSLLNMHDGSIKKLPLKVGSRAIGWNHDGRLLAIGDLDGFISIADNQGNVISSIGNKYSPDQAGTSFTALDWHPRKNVFIAANFQIGLFDSTGRMLRTMEHRNNALILAVDWHPSGNFFVIGDYGHNWSGEHVPSLLHFWAEDGSYIKAVTGNKREIRNLAFNRDGGLLASASDVLRIWNSNGALLHEGKSDRSNYLWGVSWRPDGKRIVTSSRHKTVAWWSKKAKLVKRIDLPRF